MRFGCQPGSRYEVTESGLYRKPILFVFGIEYAPTFMTANKRAKAANRGDLGARRPINPIYQLTCVCGSPEGSAH